MILISVGMSEYKFDRLLMILDELCDEGFIKGSDIIAQTGYTDFKPKNYKAFSVIDRSAYQEYVDKADCLISHAGTGSVIPALRQGKKVIVFPREEQYNEHCDNHQLELCDMLARSHYALCARTKEELRKALSDVSSFTPAEFKSNNMNLCQLIIDFIEN